MIEYYAFQQLMRKIYLEFFVVHICHNFELLNRFFDPALDDKPWNRLRYYPKHKNRFIYTFQRQKSNKKRILKHTKYTCFTLKSARNTIYKDICNTIELYASLNLNFVKAVFDRQMKDQVCYLDWKE